VRHLDVRLVGERNTEIFSLPAGVTAGKMRVAKESCGRMAEDLIGQFLVAVAALTDRIVAALALDTFAAENGEGDDDPVTLLQSPRGCGANFNHFAHHLVTHNVTGHHGRNEVVK